MSTNNKIVQRDVNFAEWYTSVIQEAKLIQYTDLKGFMIFEPKGWALWERIQQKLNHKFKLMDIKNVYMPLLIPMSEFSKEKEHVEGFAPELFTVTKIGEKQLEDQLAIRPTSEIWFCKYFKNNVHSYKDLPIKVNQWTSVLRSEKNTKPFLRNCEFHWHETHAVFQTFEESDQFSKEFLELYANFCEQELSMPVVKGEKTPNERFAGALKTYTIEAMMQDGQALQAGTSHVLGQSFAESYGIKFQNSNNKLEHIWQTSHGLTTRIIGSIIMVHGDDKGLVLPFAIADTQIKIIPLFANKNPEIINYANKIYDQLKNDYRCELLNSQKGVGYLLSESEVQGTPINIIVGPNDLESNTFTYTTRINSEKVTSNISDLTKVIATLKENYHINLYNKAKQKLDSNIIPVNNLEEFKKVISNQQWAKCYFSCSPDDEKAIKELTGATPRCIIEESKEEYSCFYSNAKTNKLVVFARAY